MNANPQNSQQQTAQPFDPMMGFVQPKQAKGVPAGIYDATFTKVEYRPAKPDSGQKWDSLLWEWKVAGGQYDGQPAYRETTTKRGSATGYAESIRWLLGDFKEGQPNPLGAIVNSKKYTIVVSDKLDKDGKPTPYAKVTNCFAKV